MQSTLLHIRTGICFLLLVGMFLLVFSFVGSHALKTPLHSAQLLTVSPHEIRMMFFVRQHHDTIQQHLRTLSLEDSIRYSELLNRFLVRFPSYTRSFSSLRDDTITYTSAHATVQDDYGIPFHPYESQHEIPLVIQNTPQGHSTPGGYRSAMQTILSHGGFHAIDSPSVRIEIDHSRGQPRGEMRNDTIVLAKDLSDTTELQKVFIHEFGHYLDINHFSTGFLSRDISHDFYDISWKTVREKKAGSNHRDFISGYASTNKFEDFAESFTFFIFHNDEFLRRASTNNILRKKYDFIASEIFGYEAFMGTAYEKERIQNVIWDSTKIPIHTPW